MCHPVEMEARFSEVFKIACPALSKVTTNEIVAIIKFLTPACHHIARANGSHPKVYLPRDPPNAGATMDASIWWRDGREGGADQFVHYEGAVLET